MMNWHEIRDGGNEWHQQRIHEAAHERLARRVSRSAPLQPASAIRTWLALALVAGARRLDSRFDTPRYETGGKEAY